MGDDKYTLEERVDDCTHDLVDLEAREKDSLRHRLHDGVYVRSLVDVAKHLEIWYGDLAVRQAVERQRTDFWIVVKFAMYCPEHITDLSYIFQSLFTTTAGKSTSNNPRADEDTVSSSGKAHQGGGAQSPRRERVVISLLSEDEDDEK